MSFKSKTKKPVQMEFVSLIDMIFILLVFFLVTSFVIRMPLQERSLFIPTPSNELGRAQILVQFISTDSILWIDESASSLVENLEENFGFLSDNALKIRIVNALIAQNVVSGTEMDERLDLLCDRANRDPFSKYFILMRCPNDLPYSKVIDIIARIGDTKYRNIKYGCIGGTIDDIRNAQRIQTIVEQAEGKRRKNIVIDF